MSSSLINGLEKIAAAGNAYKVVKGVMKKKSKLSRFLEKGKPDPSKIKTKKRDLGIEKDYKPAYQRKLEAGKSEWERSLKSGKNYDRADIPAYKRKAEVGEGNWKSHILS